MSRKWLLVSHANPDHVYGAVQIGGIVRSEDGGRTWQDVVDGIDPDVHMITQDPNDPDTIYAVCGGGGGFPASHVYPPPFLQGRPIYRSRDRARTFECISADMERSYGVPLQVHPENSSLLIAGLARGWPFDWMERDRRRTPSPGAAGCRRSTPPPPPRRPARRYSPCASSSGW